MKRITILIFLCLMLFSSLTATAVAYSIDNVLDARDISLTNTAVVGRISACGNCIQSTHTKITPHKLLRQRASGCASCGDEGDSED